jgi:hypothetical protein
MSASASLGILLKMDADSNIKTEFYDEWDYLRAIENAFLILRRHNCQLQNLLLLAERVLLINLTWDLFFKDQWLSLIYAKFLAKEQLLPIPTSSVWHSYGIRGLNISTWFLISNILHLYDVTNE